jgi:hypothetical protein
MNSSDSLIASSPVPAPPNMSKRALDRLWNAARSGYGTSSSSQITSDGNGTANDSTRSTGALAVSIASSSWPMISSIRGASRLSRRMVNSGVSILRSRVCCGGSAMPSPPGFWWAGAAPLEIAVSC